MQNEHSREYALARDGADPLARFRARFHLPRQMIYLDGNSLGPAPKAVFEMAQNCLQQEWAEGLITSWNKAGWFQLSDRLGDQLAPLIGAGKGEVVVTDSTSVNLYKALFAGLSLNPERTVILGEGASFPTDLYVSQGVLSARPELTLRLDHGDGDRLPALLDRDVAVVLVNHVDYRSGALRDLAALCRAAHDVGAVVVADLCHSAGALPVTLNQDGVDLAVGCSYKYLNGGPGAPGFIFAARRHHAKVSQPLSGWWGHADPFAFEQSYRGDPGIRKFLCGTQPILSLQALQAGLDIFSEVEMAALRQKSMALGDYFIALVAHYCADDGFTLASPQQASARGSQVSFAHEHGYAIMQALIARRVIGDFRMPNLLRFGFAPLYIRFIDIWDCVQHLRQIMQTAAWQDPRFAVRAAVT